MNKVLIVDDDTGIRFTLQQFLQKNTFLPIEASSGSAAIDIFRTEKPVAVLLDLKMPGMNGIEILDQMTKIDPTIPVIIITAFGDIPTAVETTKRGAYDFITKPPDFERLILTIKRAIEKQDLERDIRLLNSEVETSLEWTVGKSEPISKIIEQIHQVARCNYSVIIQGETGTGKSTIACLIHNLSDRRNGKFVCVDMGAIPETLVESELFGYEKGAFTGADQKKRGYFDSARDGTLLIDELQNMPLHVQSKLLRAVDEKKVYSIGSSVPTDINVRFIGATNIDIKKSVKEKRFREDLYFRLGEVIITIPPLRERSDDITFFARKFLVEACQELNKPMIELSEETQVLLRKHSWPGNIRELKNVMKRAALFTHSNRIAPEHLDIFIQNRSISIPPSTQPFEQPPFMTIREAETFAIQRAMQVTEGNKSKAASLLQIDYKTLLKKIKEYEV